MRQGLIPNSRYLEKIEIHGYGYNPWADYEDHGPTATPTPSLTPTASQTPTATPTVDPYATLASTPVRASLLRADCRHPKYISHEKAVAFDANRTSNQCFTIFPLIDIDTAAPLPAFSIHQPEIDLCLQFYEVTFQVMGIVVDIPLMITVGFAFVVIRWALTG